MNLKTIIRTLASVLILMGSAGAAHATIIELTLGDEVSGSGGTLSAPIIVTLDDGDTAGTVDLTIDMLALDSAEFLSSLYLNFDPARSPAGMTITDTDAQRSLGIIAGSNCCKPDGQADHDIQIDFGEALADRFTGGEIYTGTLSLAGLLASDFAYLSDTGNCAIARVQGLGSDALGSGWFDCVDTPNDVPEPGTLALLGLSLAGLGFARRRRVS